MPDIGVAVVDIIVRSVCHIVLSHATDHNSCAAVAIISFEAALNLYILELLQALNENSVWNAPGCENAVSPRRWVRPPCKLR